MAFWRRKKVRPPQGDDLPPSDQTWQWTGNPALGGAVFGNWGAEDVPTSLRPKTDPSKERVYDDEIDPAWRDDDS